MENTHHREARVQELRTLLIRKGLLDRDEEVVPEMLEDLAHFAYFTSCITKGDVKRLLGLTDEQTKKIIRSWKLWNEGNRSCGLTRNPFTEEWTISRKQRS